MSARRKKTKAAESLCYIGPTVPNKGLRNSTVFKNGALPAAAQECIGQLPVMEKLFVPLSGLPDAVKELSKDRSMLKSIYLRVESYSFK